MAYATDLRDAQFALTAPMPPAARKGGRFRSTDLRRVVDAVLHLLRTGCPWREMAGRWLISISRYALVDVPDQWEGRNPVAYWKDDEYDDIDFKALDYQPLRKSQPGLTISEAKAGLAIGLNVPESAIEIVVRA